MLAIAIPSCESSILFLLLILQLWPSITKQIYIIKVHAKLQRPNHTNHRLFSHSGLARQTTMSTCKPQDSKTISTRKLFILWAARVRLSNIMYLPFTSYYMMPSNYTSVIYRSSFPNVHCLFIVIASYNHYAAL